MDPLIAGNAMSEETLVSTQSNTKDLKFIRFPVRDQVNVRIRGTDERTVTEQPPLRSTGNRSGPTL